MTGEYDRLFVRASCDDTSLEEVRTILAKRIGKVWAYGMGTAKDPGSGWFEVRPKKSARGKENAILTKYLGAKLQEAFPILKGEGKVQARQMALLPLG